jgi:hypothetical protein
MSLTFKILPALALAIALSPFAAQAQSAVVAQPHSAVAAAQTVRMSSVAPSSATVDHPTVVYGGVGVNSFPDSFGG